MSVQDTLRRWFTNWLSVDDLSNTATRNRMEHMAQLRDYYDGIQPEQLKVRVGKFNDNLTVNLCGLIIDKAVSALVGDPEDGKGLSFTFPSETTTKGADGKEVAVIPPSVEWVNGIWRANQQEIFIHKNALSGATYGTPAVKIVPDGAGAIRLVNLNPLLLTIDTDPQDVEKMTRYTIYYHIEENGKETQYKEVTEPTNPEGTSWSVTTWKQEGRRQWEQVGAPVLWAYPFPPILTWQNLPATDTPYGRSDIEGIIELQNRLNFVLSNVSKITRLYAHPQRYAKNITQQQTEVEIGPDEMPAYNGEGEIVQLEQLGDLPAVIQFQEKIQELVYRLAREVDFTMVQAAGDLSNYRVELMCRDFLDKLGTKRMLYGNAYTELNRRLLILGGYEGEECTVNWADPLPVNEQEETTALQADMNMGLVSKQTASEMRGYDWQEESERMGTEQQNSNNAGKLLIDNFLKTGENGNRPPNLQKVNNA